MIKNSVKILDLKYRIENEEAVKDGTGGKEEDHWAVALHYFF